MNKDKKIHGYIYLIRNNVNGKIYIGQTIRDFDRRYRNDIINTQNAHLHNAICKYGNDSFCVDKEFDIAYSQEELDLLEDMYIKAYNTTNSKYGYNKRYGGHGGALTESHKSKIGMANRGHKHTPECKKRISESMKQYKKNQDNEITEETRKKMSDSLKGVKNPASRRVVCLNTREVFQTISCASEKYNAKSITRACKGTKRYSGFNPITNEMLMWMYYEDFILLTESDINERLNLDKESAEKYIRREDIGVPKKVVCLNTSEVFDSMTEATYKFNLKDVSRISKCCKGKRKSAGKHPITGEPLRWMYYDEWVSRPEIQDIDKYHLE